MWALPKRIGRCGPLSFVSDESCSASDQHGLDSSKANTAGIG